MYKPETLMPDSVGQAFLSPEAFLALIAMCCFWNTIVRPDSILTNDRIFNYGQGSMLDSPDILKLVDRMQPAILAASGQYDKAAVAADELLKEKPHDTLTNLCAGNVFIKAGVIDEGLKHLKKSVALARASRYVRINYAQKLTLLKHHGDAIDQYRTLIKFYPRWLEPHMELAKLLLSIDRAAEAAQELKAVIDLSPSHSSAHKLRGLALAQTGQTQTALDEYMMGIARETATGVPDSIRDLITNWGTFDRAIYELQQQANQRPDDYLPKLRLAQLLSYIGQQSESKELLFAVRRMAPNNPEVHRTLAVVLKKLGDSQQALSEFMLSVSLEKAQERTRQ